MYTALTILHIIVAFIMVGVILLQSGKGAEIGAAFGGSSQTVFGARGASTMLSRVTAITATVFMVTSLTLAIMSKQRNYASTLGLDKPTPAQTAPAAAPAAPESSKDDHGAHDPNAPVPASPAPTKP